LVEHYRTERARGSDEISVAFFGGMVPTTEMLQSIGDLPFSARVRPDLLTRAKADELVAQGARGIELDVGTFDDFALRWCGRPYTSSRVTEMADGLRNRGLRVGIVLTPGLPGTDFETARRDATLAAQLAHTVRLHPTLVLAGSKLHEMYDAGRYTPLSKEVAIHTCLQMMDLLEASGVTVIRVGAQPGPDGMGRLVAGPYHPSLRELVESKRAQVSLRRQIALLDAPSSIVIRCAASDETRARGPANANIRLFRIEFALEHVVVRSDPALQRGQWAVEKIA
jgi:hypothetical protein